MKISLKIFDSILFQELNPNRDYNKQVAVFKEMLNDNLRLYKDDPAMFYSKLPDAIKTYYPYLDLPTYTITTPGEMLILPTRFELLKISQYFDKITEFYSYLIDNECSRIFDAISFSIYSNPEFIDRIYLVSTLKGQLELLMKNIGEQNWEEKQSVFILNSLKIKVFRLYNELIFHYEIYHDGLELNYSEILNILIPEYNSQNGTIGSISYDIKCFIEEAKTIIDVKPVKKKVVAQHQTYNSFKYPYYSTNPDKLNFLFYALMDNNFIDSGTQLANFKKIFKNTQITKPVKWIGTISELFYFIKYLHHISKLVEDTKQMQYEIACKCFIKPDDTFFDKNQLKQQKKPKKTASIIEKYVNNLQ
jgi:hypothetical protein